MKKLLLISLLIMPFLVSAQKVDIKIDDFTNDTIITTSWEKIYGGGLSGQNQTRIQLKKIGSENYMYFRIFTNDVASINKGSKVLIKTSNDIVNATVVEYAITEPGAWSPSKINNKLGIFFKCAYDVNELQSFTIEKIRIPFTDGNLDLDIKKKDSDKIQKMISMILSAK